MAMKILSATDVFQEVCKIKRCWGLMFKVAIGSVVEMRKAAPYLEGSCIHWVGELGYIFGTRRKIVGMFWQTVGDDGPTKMNPYDGPARVYAMTCDSNGDLQHENT